MFQTFRGKMMGLLTVSLIFMGGFVFGKTDIGMEMEAKVCKLVELTSCQHTKNLAFSPLEEKNEATNERVSEPFTGNTESPNAEDSTEQSPAFETKQAIRNYATEKTNAINQMEATIQKELSKNILDVYNNRDDVSHLNRDISLEVIIGQLAHQPSTVDEKIVNQLNRDLLDAYETTKESLTKKVIEEKQALLKEIDLAKYEKTGTLESFIEPKMIMIYNNLLVEKHKLEEKQEYIIQSYALNVQAES